MSIIAIHDQALRVAELIDDNESNDIQKLLDLIAAELAKAEAPAGTAHCGHETESAYGEGEE